LSIRSAPAATCTSPVTVTSCSAQDSPSGTSMSPGTVTPSASPTQWVTRSAEAALPVPTTPAAPSPMTARAARRGELCMIQLPCLPAVRVLACSSMRVWPVWAGHNPDAWRSVQQRRRLGIQAVALVLPLPAGEVGDLHWSAAAQRLPRQRHRGAPGCRVVDVDIGDQSLPDALHRAVDEHVVHAAVAAVVLRIVADVAPEPVVVLVQEGLGILPGVA